MEAIREIERSLITTHRKSIWRPFTGAVAKYALLSPGDRVAVCISGGKDSMVLAKCMQELQRHGKHPLHLEFVVMDPGYNPENRRRIEENATRMGIPIRIFESSIFAAVANVDDSPCYLCARMRRGHLYSYARELGCNKIALGHHMDDVIETVLMSMLYAGQIRTMMPKLHSTNFPGLELIRPLYHVRESAILGFGRHHGIQFLQCACRFTEDSSLEENRGMSKRQEMKELIRQLHRTNPGVEQNILRSLENVNLETVVGWKDARGRHSFLDTYDDMAPGGRQTPPAK